METQPRALTSPPPLPLLPRVAVLVALQAHPRIRPRAEEYHTAPRHWPNGRRMHGHRLVRQQAHVERAAQRRSGAAPCHQL